MRPIMDAAKWAIDSLRFSDTNWLIQDASGTPHLQQQAWSLVINGYRCWASQPRTEGQLFHDLCADQYVARGHTRTLVLRGVAPGGGQTGIIGTVRQLICPQGGPDSALPPLEAMGMLGSAERWQRFFATQCRLPHAFEIGRIALADSLTDERARSLGLHHAVITLLIAGAIGFADAGFARQDCVAVLSERIRKAMRAAQVDVHVYEDFDLNPRQTTLVQSYARYWLEDKPQVCRLAVAPAAVRPAAAKLDQLFPVQRRAA
jgi:hypothetical protein